MIGVLILVFWGWFECWRSAVWSRSMSKTRIRDKNRNKVKIRVRNRVRKKAGAEYLGSFGA
ncbi:hypothetical protein BVY03_05435 [bacterium K02(2017)]|nr:hypothetical protein BVY03_05435 [bacterium K02(2017)]